MKRANQSEVAERRKEIQPRGKSWVGDSNTDKPRRGERKRTRSKISL